MSVVILFIALIAYIIYVVMKGGLPRVTMREPVATTPSYISFQRSFESVELENRCKEHLYDPSRRDGIWEIISGVLSELDDWENYSRNDFDRMERTSTGEYRYADESMVIAIMMAEYGKMSSKIIEGWADWDFTSWHNRTKTNAIKGYQLARWFATKFVDYDDGLQLYAENINGRNYAWNKSRRAAIFQRGLTQVVPTYTE